MHVHICVHTYTQIKQLKNKKQKTKPLSQEEYIKADRGEEGLEKAQLNLIENEGWPRLCSCCPQPEQVWWDVGASVGCTGCQEMGETSYKTSSCL